MEKRLNRIWSDELDKEKKKSLKKLQTKKEKQKRGEIVQNKESEKE